MLDAELQKINYMNLLFLKTRKINEKKNTKYNIEVIDTGSNVIFQKEIKGDNEKMVSEINVYVY